MDTNDYDRGFAEGSKTSPSETSWIDALVGSPPRTVEDWLGVFADDNFDAAERSVRPSTRRRYRAQAWAFVVARDLVRQATEQSRKLRLSQAQGG